MIILGGKAWLWLGGVACAGVVERQWNIFCYNVQCLVRFGVSFLSCCDIGCVPNQLACWRNWFGKHSSEV